MKKKRLMIWVAVLAALALAALFTGGCSGRGETGSGAGDGLSLTGSARLLTSGPLPPGCRAYTPMLADKVNAAGESTATL